MGSGPRQGQKPQYSTEEHPGLQRVFAAQTWNGHMPLAHYYQWRVIRRSTRFEGKTFEEMKNSCPFIL